MSESIYLVRSVSGGAIDNLNLRGGRAAVVELQADSVAAVRINGVVYQSAVLAGFQSNGANIPPFAHPIIGRPLDSDLLLPSIHHDWGYYTHVLHARILGELTPVEVSRATIDRFYYEFLRAHGIGYVRANLILGAVRAFGEAYWHNDQNDKEYLLRLKTEIVASGRNPKRYGLI